MGFIGLFWGRGKIKISFGVSPYRVSQKKLGLAETGHGYILYGINERKTLLLHSKFIVLNANTWFDSKDIKFLSQRIPKAAIQAESINGF